MTLAQRQDSASSAPLTSSARNQEQREPVTARHRRHAMSVDVEDYYHAWAITSAIGKAAWTDWPSRVDDSTRRILDLFDRAGVKGTFFVLGWVAERQPSLVREIVARGHELASHGFSHDKVHELSQEGFLKDVRRTRLLLEDQGGVAVSGYRAPSFSIDRNCWWAYDILAEAGYGYSSSLHPIRHDHYGMPDAPLPPFRPKGGAVVEVPVAVVDWRGRRISCAGGGHFRIFPYRWSRWWFDRLHAEDDRTGVFYLHPWEIDQDQPRVPGLPLRSRIRHYAGQGRMESKLARMLGTYCWDRLDRLVDFDAVPGDDLSAAA